MFEIANELFGNYQIVKIKNRDTGEYISVIPEYGLCLNEIVLESNGRLESILLNNDNPNDFKTIFKPMFSGVKLFPFPNRVKDGKYQYNKVKYKLPQNDPPRNHSLHHFIYDQPFSLISFDKITGTTEFIYNNDGLFDYYPFPFSMSITVQLINQGVVIKTVITNTGGSDIPFGDGWHPYISTGTKIDKLSVQIPSGTFLEVDEVLIPTMKKGVNEDFLQLNIVKDTSFDNCFIIDTKENKASTIIYDPVKQLKIDIWQETGNDKYNYVQYYTPDNRKSIAVEPMSCAPNAINNGLGLIHLKPKEKKEFTFGIKILND
ncbi:MAG: aldose 1-epimerase [Bacteroidales bacterium]|nr:aldose 1-epimerase [Bacteroidales bacterium]